MISKEEQEFLNSYSDKEFEKPSVTVDAVILRIKSVESKNYRKLPEKKLQIFLQKRDNFPFKDCYATVGSFINLETELATSMKNCVKKEVDLNNYYYEQLFTFGDKERDPRTRVLSVSYLLLTNDSEKLTNGDWFDIDLKEVSSSLNITKTGFEIKKTINLTFTNGKEKFENIINITNTKNGLEETKIIELTENSLAFDHAKIVYHALERLKNKLEYTDIIFNLLPKEFTLTELKQCYEIILQEHLLDANFRRKIAKMVIPINKLQEARGHRTSQLFSHNPTWRTNDLD